MMTTKTFKNTVQAQWPDRVLGRVTKGNDNFHVAFQGEQGESFNVRFITGLWSVEYAHKGLTGIGASIMGAINNVGA